MVVIHSSTTVFGRNLIAPRSVIHQVKPILAGHVAMLELFIDQKSQQLIYFVSRFLRGQIPHQELHLFIWDTLEEWAQLQISHHTPANFREQVFWHVLYQLEYWSEQELLRDKILRKKLHNCLGYLRGKVCLPLDCVGVRP